MRSRERPFWLAQTYDFNVSAHEKFVEKLRPIRRNPVRRGLVAQPEDCHPTDEDLSVGTPVAVVELSPLSNGRARNRGDRIGLDSSTKRLAAARVDARSPGCLLDFPGPLGWTKVRLPGPRRLGTGAPSTERDYSSPVPKGEGPGAPSMLGQGSVGRPSMPSGACETA